MRLSLSFAIFVSSIAAAPLSRSAIPLTNNFTMTGKAFYDIEQDRFVLRVKTTGRWTCDLKYVRSGDQVNTTGKCNGKRINMAGPDDDREKHQMPDLNAPKQD